MLPPTNKEKKHRIGSQDDYDAPILLPDVQSMRRVYCARSVMDALNDLLGRDAMRRHKKEDKKLFIRRQFFCRSRDTVSFLYIQKTEGGINDRTHRKVEGVTLNAGPLTDRGTYADKQHEANDILCTNEQVRRWRFGFVSDMAASGLPMRGYMLV